ncbi:TlpA disulfide reductase family protein [Chryseobacterium sp.]|uniref:TlpA family protein disulfide reductase n=1 Tax=Chryseobacterium sp. TaxID=1871047 RepID=UPI0025BA208D|nr:TlpA disulfide reductase family protein [Chryseobacterium sp.]MBV8325199.1 TlpA family protein disulfide reductase [Chryseobacterium sp.]
MENLKKWIKNNWSTAILTILFIILLVNTDARAWLMRQVASTGILNSGISESSKDKGNDPVRAHADLLVKNEDGSLVNTTDLKGKVIFINFWASWCPPCRAEFPSVQKFYNQYKNHPDMVFLTINLDDQPESGKVYLKEKELSVPFLTPAGSIPKEFFSGSLPTTVILDKKGEIRLHHEGLADYSKESFYTEINELLQKP